LVYQIDFKSGKVMNFKDVILQNISKLETFELMEIKVAIEKQLEVGGLVTEARRLLVEDGKLRACKYVRATTGWTLGKAKEFVDGIEIEIRNQKRN
jgi:ribosomal protein L7/L12